MEDISDIKQMIKRPLQHNETVHLTKRVRTNDDTMEIGLRLLNKDIGRVIGKGGEQVKNIRLESGTSINIPKDSNSYDRLVYVKGNVEQSSTAIRMIANVVSEENPVISILAEHRNLGALIGKQGVTINHIREETQATVDIGKECLGNSTQKEIRISGDPEAFSKAVQAVVCKLAEGRNAVRVPYIPSSGGHYNGPSLYSANVGGMPVTSQVMPYQHDREASTPSFFQIETTITVPKKMIGKIIGRGGCNVNAVRRQSGAQINISTEEEDGQESKITITGQRTSIELACSMLESLAKSLQD